ncbi:MAG: hypothetical protein QXR60_02625 [Candidatus Nanoarchaeia archaeon]
MPRALCLVGGINPAWNHACHDDNQIANHREPVFGRLSTPGNPEQSAPGQTSPL